MIYISLIDNKYFDNISDSLFDLVVSEEFNYDNFANLSEAGAGQYLYSSVEYKYYEEAYKEMFGSDKEVLYSGGNWQFPLVDFCRHEGEYIVITVMEEMR